MFNEEKKKVGVCGKLPFTLAQGPTGDDPQRNHKDEEDGARANSHQRLENETRIEVDTVKSADGAR